MTRSDLAEWCVNVTEPTIAYHSEYAPDIYEVVVNGARIGSVQRYGKREWVPYMAPGFRTALREYTTRGDAGAAMALAWKRAHEDR